MNTSRANKSVPVAGSTMTVVDVGEGDTIVLGPSYLTTDAMWQSQIEVLSRRHRVIVPNPWGQGGSGAMPVGTRDLRDIARHHLELLDHLGVDAFSLFGLSLGGMWGGELALMAPDRITRLALLDTSLDAEPDEARRTFFALLDTIEAAGAIPDAMLDAIVPLFFAPDVASRAPRLPLNQRLAMQDVDRDTLLGSTVPLGRMIFGRRSLLGELHRLKMPALVMTGAGDIPQPVSTGRRTAEALGAPFIAIPQAGHLAPLEAPEAVSRHLLAFLDGEMAVPA